MSLVLIVEDNEKNLKLVRDVLQAKGYATLEAGTAEAGLALARARKPGLILMDIHLPGMSGIEALKILRAEAATAAIPVIAITASVMKESVREVMAAGFNAFIEKPINVLGFLEQVRGILGEDGK
jgi:two-component system, cell cycle response regulator DivK